MDEKQLDRYYVLGQLVEAVAILSNSTKTSALLPEIRSNLVMAIRGAHKMEDIAGIPGRLTAVSGKITASAYPDWGVSKNSANMLLAIMGHDPSHRAAIVIKYSDELVELFRNSGISIKRLEIAEGKSIDEMFAPADGCDLPTAFYSEGGFSREGIIIVASETAVEVVNIAIRIADLLNP